MNMYVDMSTCMCVSMCLCVYMCMYQWKRCSLCCPVLYRLSSSVYLPSSCNAELHVISVGGSGTGSDGGGGGGGGGGGIWQFPLHFKATVAAPDDVITVEAKGLHKETQVGFRLTSMVE